MHLREFLVEVSKKLGMEKFEVDNFVFELCRTINDVNFDNRIYHIGGMYGCIYGISDIEYPQNLSEAEISKTCNEFEKIIKKAFDLKAKMTIKLIHSWEMACDDEGINFEDTKCYLVSWYIISH